MIRRRGYVDREYSENIPQANRKDNVRAFSWSIISLCKYSSELFTLTFVLFDSSEPWQESCEWFKSVQRHLQGHIGYRLNVQCGFNKAILLHNSRFSARTANQALGI